MAVVLRIQVRLPLAGVAADKAVEIFEAHAVRPLIERPGLARLVRRRVVVLAEPRGGVAVRLQDRADGAFVDRDDRIVTRITRRNLADHPGAHRVMVASRDDRRPRRRAERSGVEIRVAQPLRGDTVKRRRRDHAAKRAGRTEAGIVGHDEQHIGRALRRHDARGPPGLRLRSLLLDHSAEFGGGRRNLFSVDRGRGAGRTRDTGDLLRHGRSRREQQGRRDNPARCDRRADTANTFRSWMPPHVFGNWLLKSLRQAAAPLSMIVMRHRVVGTLAQRSMRSARCAEHGERASAMAHRRTCTVRKKRILRNRFGMTRRYIGP